MALTGTHVVGNELPGQLTLMDIKHVNKAVHTWTIQDFPGRLKEAELDNKIGDIMLQSGPFEFPIQACWGGERMLQFTMFIELHWEEATGKATDDISIAIQCLSLEKDVTLRLQLKMDGPEHHMLKEEHLAYSKFHKHTRYYCFSKHTWTEHATRFGGRNGNLTFITELEFEFEKNKAEGSPLEIFLWNNRWSTGDITIACGDKQIPVHKGVLAARSSVFEAMFQHKHTLENKTSLVCINDVNPECLNEFIRYIYLNEFTCADLSAEIINALLVAADKYLISSLKTRCEYMLGRMVNATNVGHYGILATMYNAPFLRKSIVKFVTSNYSKMADDPDGQWSLLPVDIVCEANPQNKKPKPTS